METKVRSVTTMLVSWGMGRNGGIAVACIAGGGGILFIKDNGASGNSTMRGSASWSTRGGRAADKKFLICH